MVKSKLVTIFNGHDESLKFKAAFALMHDYEYQYAYDYLMEKMQEVDNWLVQFRKTW
ncbi:MAG TPA: hypothetical protein VFG10_03820 [Saprospiraceae bacterium]|nr:hypothetical protein [Saprospiraceae bacterium]